MQTEPTEPTETPSPPVEPPETEQVPSLRVLAEEINRILIDLGRVKCRDLYAQGWVYACRSMLVPVWALLSTAAAMEAR